MSTFKERLISVLAFTPTSESDYVLLEVAATDAQDREIAGLIAKAIERAREEGEADVEEDLLDLERELRNTKARADEAIARADKAERDLREAIARADKAEAAPSNECIRFDAVKKGVEP